MFLTENWYFYWWNFHLNGYNDTHFWSVPFMIRRLGCGVPLLLHEQQVPYSSNRAIDSGWYVNDSLWPFLSASGKKTCGFLQDGATAHTANYSISVPNKMFDNRLISHRLWPVKSSDQNQCDFYLSRKLKNKLNSNNSHTVDELQHDIYERITTTEVNELV
jgi:hypothetical protein